MMVGAPGAGKTMLGQQIGFHHARQGEPTLYLTGYSETHDKLVAHNRPRPVRPSEEATADARAAQRPICHDGSGRVTEPWPPEADCDLLSTV